ncbi:DNA-binding protein [Ectopseudomonas toyotomiensis]|uniref:Arc-like DNA binding domain-containing protein n=1 Tax=Ectopseudomonas toyotomiensis TaxID=554344 RepID=A0A1I5R3T6_9GAMM|nr:Arc family DNA-binding protein [Pseudomonas toyotomiensis]PIA74319.1 DNA-binding protein [Pseudomonas toyotomiensis]SFP52981.1 Arc-like DNA binding domain-containing protein [Pseudomonas toyotomiensis]
MKRTDPQFKLRIPENLKAKVDDSAKANHRSVNAEIVARLEASFDEGVTLEKLVPVKKAQELSLIARRRIPDIVRQRIIKAINKAIAMGHSAASAEFYDLDLEGGLSGEEASDLLHGIDEELLNAGYEVEWDGPAAVTIFLWPPERA